MSETTVKEHPILFSGDMVRAILDGRKTQTRRVMPQPTCDCNVRPEQMSLTSPEGWQMAGHSGRWWCPCCTGDWRPRCPYGVPGDRLWVRETWRRPFNNSDAPLQAGQTVLFRATSPWHDGFGEGWRPSIYMPRWASRILLKVTEVRVQRLQDITTADVLAEGYVKRKTIDGFDGYGKPEWPVEFVRQSPQDALAHSWNELNAKRGYGWDANPWVWAITFNRIEEPPR